MHADRAGPMIGAARFVVAAVGLATVGLVMGRRTLLRVTVRGDSMLPALGDGDRVLAVRTPPARIRRGAVVVGRAPAGVAPAGPVRLRDPVNGEVVELVADPDPVFVKRVAGVPGDRVRPRHAPVGPDGSTPTAEVEVPAGTFFVEGETTFSMDSCLWGPVPADHVLGVVVGASRRTARAPRTGVQVPR